MPVERVALSGLRGTASPRLEGVDGGHAGVLAAVPGPLPPIVVHRQTMRVIDGAHRVRAAEIRGESEIGARLVDCDEAGAFLLAVSANARHGLPLSLADRKAAAARIIGLYPEWSDRMIAEASGLAAKTVAAARERPTEDNQQLDARVGRDGRARPVDGARRRERAAELLKQNPGASLRDIAREAEVSPETVRGVRRRLTSADGDGDTAPPGAGNAAQAPKPPPRPSTAPGRHAAGPAPADGKPALDKLRKDPALRSTDIGRLLISGLAAPANFRRKITAVLNAVPPYCLDWLGRVPAVRRRQGRPRFR